MNRLDFIKSLFGAPFLLVRSEKDDRLAGLAEDYPQRMTLETREHSIIYWWSEDNQDILVTDLDGNMVPVPFTEMIELETEHWIW
jgi:hypothetical protein